MGASAGRNPGETNGLDAVDEGLIQHLRTDGRASTIALADQLGVSKATIAKRIRRLADAGIMRVVAVTDTQALGHEYQGFVEIQVKDRAVSDVAEDLARLREVITVVGMFGSYDLFGIFLAQDRAHLSELVNSQIPAIPGVDRVESGLALETFVFRTEWGFLDRSAPPPMTGADPRVDETDVSIIHLLQIDGRVSNRSIAEQLGISEGTVRTRIKRLEQDHCIRIVAVTDQAQLGMESFAIMHIDVDSDQLRTIAGRICQFDEVTYAASILGRHNLLVGVMSPTRLELVEFVTQRMAKLPGVRRTEVSEGAQAFKHTFTWCQLTGSSED